MKIRCALVGLACLAMTFAAHAQYTAQPSPSAPRTISFEDRVKAQAAIERVYYRHQIGAAKPFEEAVPRSLLEAKVNRYLAQSVALTTYWHTPITDVSLQRELERMAGGSRIPERLQEIFAALNKDSFVIKECLARATLADRLTHNFYALDPRFHAAARQSIDDLHHRLESGELPPKADHPNRFVSELVVAQEGAADPGPTIDAVSQAEFSEQRGKLPAATNQVSEITETRDAFVFRIVLSETADRMRVATYAVPKVSWDAWWRSVSPSLAVGSVAAVAGDGLRLPTPRKGSSSFDPNAPCTGDGWNNGILDDVPQARYYHSAVWTGSTMIVWGGASLSVLGGFNSGGRYDPATDTWSATSLVAAPMGRAYHSAVWTGSEMIVWGGNNPISFLSYTNIGARYDPVADRWRTMSLAGAPSPRTGHSAVWTGSRFVVWGGQSVSSGGSTGYLRDGASYDPSSNAWTPIATSGAPAARAGHSAVWTGNRMIVWGGSANSFFPYDDGAAYDPSADLWSPISYGPAGHSYHSAAWTGTQMIVWGGYSAVPCSYCDQDYAIRNVNTGARYDPSRDAWLPMTTNEAPGPVPETSVVWTGHRMLVWGGDVNGNIRHSYDPSVDRWALISDEGAPAGRQGHTAIWTGHIMIVWGGRDTSLSTLPEAGGRYDPWSDTWTQTSPNGGPSARSGHTAVWTGTFMIVWGGGRLLNPSVAYAESGGKYDPATDAWSSTSVDGAPIARSSHSAVWSGDRMIVWGGFNSSYGYFDSGGRYDPAADAWEATSSVDAPAGRSDHSAVWTGHVMIVWGGGGIVNNVSAVFNTGARYEPATDTWIPTSEVGAPSARRNHTGVWDGNRMLIWGGGVNGALVGDGGRYDAASDSWTSIAVTGAPSARWFHTAVWASDRMVVWGGQAGSNSGLNTGGRYDPAADIWAPTSVTEAPSGRSNHVAVTNGSLMFVWGGGGSLGLPNTGGIYDIAQDRWTRVTREGEPAGFRGTGVWSGDALIVWTGTGGGRYYPGESLEDDCDGDGFSVLAGDCEDHRPAVYPGAPAICDGIHNDCRNLGWPVISNDSDRDADGFTPCQGDCQDSDPAVFPGAPEPCDGTDNNCDGGLELDQDRDSYRTCQGDCDDARASVHPNARESCNGQDDNCDGAIDETGDALCNGNCRAGVCHGAEGCTYVQLTGACDDFNSCTSNDTCVNGDCRGTKLENGAPCDKHNVCYLSAACSGGYCYLASPVQCSDGDPCNGLEYCDDLRGGCVVSGPYPCDDGNICTTDSCDPASGQCSHVDNNDPCDDGNACTEGDVCTESQCFAGTATFCDDGNPCTDDLCDPASGCVHMNNDGACDDGNACTRWDACEAGACVGHDPVVCGAADACHTEGICDPASGVCSGGARPDGTPCADGDLCTAGDRCLAGTCTPVASGLNEPNPRSTGYYMSLCLGGHSGDQLTDADAACVGRITRAFAGVATVVGLCAELMPSQPNNDPCDRTDDDLLVLALNVCRGRVCTAQSIESQCGTNTEVGQSLAESDAILADPARGAASCAHAKCLDEEINSGRALELNSLTLRLESGAVRLTWIAPSWDDGATHPDRYHVWRRVRGSLAPFSRIATTVEPTYLDPPAPEAFEYEITAMRN